MTFGSSTNRLVCILRIFSGTVVERNDDTAEDTFLLLDALEQDVKTLRDQRPVVCLEIGYAHRLFKRTIRLQCSPDLALDACLPSSDAFWDHRHVSSVDSRNML
jgi:hypothetical protein